MPDRPSWSSRTILHHMYAAKSAKTHHCSAYAALRQLSPLDGSRGGGTRSIAEPAVRVASGDSPVAKRNAL